MINEAGSITLEGELNVGNPNSYDGYISIKVEIDTENMKTGKKDLEKAMNAMLKGLKVSSKDMLIRRK